MEGLLAAAREVLGMELAYLAEVRESELVLREVDGDTAGYGGVAPGFALPREQSWCHAMVAGEAPQLVPDAAAIRRPPRTRSSPRPGSAPTRACRCAAPTARSTARSAA